MTTVHIDLREKFASIPAVHDNMWRRNENRTRLSRTPTTTDTSQCFVVGICIPQRHVVLKSGFFTVWPGPKDFPLLE